MRKSWFLFGLPLCLAVLLAWGVAVEPGLLIGRHVSRNAWPGSDLKIVFFSDLHAGSPHIDREYVEKLIGRIDGESPDIILIGGDMVINGIIGGTKQSRSRMWRTCLAD